ncbi:hypothetical protein ACHAP5_007449 [Fusarium lateritium]
MAKHVAETNDVEVPHRTAIALERGIWVRRSFSQQLKDSGVRRDRRSDASHSYFVEVLEQVRDYLKPIMEAGLFQPENLSKGKKDAKKNPVKNMFKLLNVYTPSESFLNAPDITPEPASEEEDEKYTVQETETWEDAAFAFVTLLRDYETLTQEVHALWTKYSAGQLDLAVVSVATNTAFQIARAMEESHKPLLDKHGSCFKLASSLFEQYCETVGIDVDQKPHGGVFNVEAYDMAKPLYIGPMGLLQAFASSCRNNDMTGTYNGVYGWYDERLGAASETPSQRWTQDISAMMELMPDLRFLSSHRRRGAVEDELMRGVVAMFQTSSSIPPLWLSWAAQIFLDILQSAGENCGRAYGQMKQESLKIQKALMDLPDSQERKKVLEAAMRWDTDPLWTARQAVREYDPQGARNLPQFRFLHRNPLHCGLLLHHMRSVLHHSGITTAAYSGGLMVTAQLYHALQQEGRLADLKWEDLEALWKFQGNATFFVGKPPEDREGYFRNFGLSIGLSAANWGTNRRSPQPGEYKRNQRNMKIDGWVSLSLNNRIATGNPREPWTAAMVEELLIEGRRNETLDGKGHVITDLSSKGKEVEPEPVPKTPSGVVDELAQVLQKEIPRLTFNYFNMHYIAWNLLTKLKEAFTEAMGPSFLRYVPTEDQLPFVVGYVFSTSSGHGSSDVQERGLSNDALLDIATTVVREFLEDGEGRLIKEASEQRVEPEDVEGIDIITGLWENKGRSGEIDAIANAGRGHVPDNDIESLVRLLQALG